MTTETSLNVQDTLTALYNQASVNEQGKEHSFAGKALCNSNDAYKLFESACPDHRCILVRGKYMPVDFEQFPKLNVTQYDERYGVGAAEKAIRAFQGYDEKNCMPCNPHRISWLGEVITFYR